MIPAEQHIWRLSKRGDQNLGLVCTEDGLFLGRTPLLEWRGGCYAVRPKDDLERLLNHAYGPAIGVERVLHGLATVASALSQKNLCLAQIAALHLQLPDLPDAVTRDGLEAEDQLIKHPRSGGGLARAAWDEAEHPRAGVPPNPGWFVPKPGSADAPLHVAQARGRRGSEEILGPTGPVRQAMWSARIARLREIDPGNPNLTYFSNPNSLPSQEALDRLDAAIEAASIKRVTDKVMQGTLIQLPGRAGYITFRPVSDSGSPAVDINVPGVPFDKIHFR